jgi:hypothetical protein
VSEATAGETGGRKLTQHFTLARLDRPEILPGSITIFFRFPAFLTDER